MQSWARVSSTLGQFSGALMYFDHVRCPSCGCAFDPEKIQTQGDSMSCPRCKAQLGLRSLFGVSDQFSEEDAPQMTLDDLVPGKSGSRSHDSEPSPRARGGGSGSSKDLPARQGSEGTSAADMLRTIKKQR